MDIGIYCIKDVVAQDSMPPVCFRSHKEAVRGFKAQMVKISEKGDFEPVDFELYYLGTFDTSVPAVQSVGSGGNRLAYFGDDGNLVSLADGYDE